ncbi:MAG: stage 0 sporulation family protein [Lachnospiraceae bacterium]|nr:stage 0 sporulation family protein [Lachnospiraceae bacterium]
MVKVIGVRFRTAGKIYYFGPKDIEFKRSDHVIVETARGVEYGTVVLPNMEVEDSKITQPLKNVIRKATEDDDEREKRNREKEKDAYKICQEKIIKHGLEMKLINAEYTFDNNKVLFYFTADGRVDFRELVKDLAGVFRTRIELRQVGVRDETKILGGMGICGRALCCHSYLADFAPVSIKMAKEQSLSLNPTKISGICGRLMCCLQNEAQVYEELNRKLPKVGDTVTTPDGIKGEVRETNVLKQLVKVIVEIDDEKELREYAVSDLKFKPRHKKDNDGQKGDKGGKKNKNKDKDKDKDNSNKKSKAEIEEELELEELERLEQKDGRSKLDDD